MLLLVFYVAIKWRSIRLSEMNVRVIVFCFFQASQFGKVGELPENTVKYSGFNINLPKQRGDRGGFIMFYRRCNCQNYSYGYCSSFNHYGFSFFPLRRWFHLAHGVLSHYNFSTFRTPETAAGVSTAAGRLPSFIFRVFVHPWWLAGDKP